MIAAEEEHAQRYIATKELQGVRDLYKDNRTGLNELGPFPQPLGAAPRPNSNAIAAQALQGRPRDGCTPVNEALRAPTYSKTYFFR